MQKRILSHSLSEVLTRSVAGAVPGTYIPEHQVFQIGFIIEFIAYIHIDRRSERMKPGREFSIEIRGFACVFPVNATVAGVEAAYCKTFIPQKFFPEKRKRYIQVML